MASKVVLALHKELKGILVSLDGAASWFDGDRFVRHANQVIERGSAICPEITNMQSYNLTTERLNDGRVIVQTTQAKQKLLSLIGRIEGEYSIEDYMTNTGHTFIQNQTQSQSQILNLTLEMQAKILAEIPKHAEGTKERTFLEKLKETLPLVKNTTDILSSTLKIGSELGLDPATMHKILGL